MDFFDSVFSPEAYREAHMESPLYRALYQSEEWAFRELNKLQGSLPLHESVRCLRKAMLDGSEELFRQILEHSAVGEGSGQYHLPIHTPGWGIQCHGSLVTLAAVMDRPRQVQVLLEHGYDVNGSGLAVADYLRQEGNVWCDKAPLYARFCSSAGCQIQVESPKRVDVGISCVTPLAAALLSGSLSAAEVLLGWNGVWKSESTAVCRAAAIALEGLANPALSPERQHGQKEILRQIFFPERDALPDRQTFLRSTYLQPASFVDICRTSTLRYQLESGLCTEEDARQMLEILSIDMWWRSGEQERSKAAKLLLLKRHFPRLCREGWVTGVFLREAARRIREDQPYKTMLNAWKQLCGKERDLTWIGSDIWELRGTKRKLFYQEAHEDGSLIMDADALKGWYAGSRLAVSEMLKRVRFRQRDGDGVSGLTQQLLGTGDLRLLQQAVKLGILSREDPRLLLECPESDRQDIRAIVLTYARKQPEQYTEMADWKDPRRWDCWCQWKERSSDEMDELLRELMQEKQSGEECLRSMFCLHQHLDRGIFALDMVVHHTLYPMLKTDSLAGFACCAESGQAMGLLLEHMPDHLLRTLRADWGEQFHFRGTALTLAAALGRTEQVKLLLGAGIHPDEEGRGDVSRFFVRRSDFSEKGFPVTPVLAAILFGQRETASLLLQAGACCDFSRPEHLNVLMQGSAESWKLAKALPCAGFDAIPAETLEAMRIVTDEHGERTCFWQSLQQEPLCS